MTTATQHGMHPKYFVKRRAVPIPTQKGLKIRTRSAKVYESVEPETEKTPPESSITNRWEKENVPEDSRSGTKSSRGVSEDEVKHVRSFIANHVNDKHKNNYSRRFQQLNNCGYHAAINKPYQGMGDPFYLEEKKVILHGLGQWQEVGICIYIYIDICLPACM